MNKNEFLKIASEVVMNKSDDFIDKGASPQVVLAATLTMQMIVHDLADNIFDLDDEIEIER